MTRRTFTAPVAGGELGGWVEGDGESVVLLHGGPGLEFNYLDEVAADIGGGWRVAAYQQRGLAPSTTSGPFGIAQEIEDFQAVLNALGWDRTWIAGHSWGGHFALRLAAACPDRLLGVLAIDPIGIVGDGGTSAFEAEMTARLNAEGRAQMKVFDEREAAGDASEELGLAAMQVYWPSYFADPENVPPILPTRACPETQAAISPEMAEGLEAVQAAIVGGDVPIGLLAGGASPIPWGEACRSVANLRPGIQLIVAPGAGHFCWYEAPGCVRDALERLRGH